MGNKKICYGCKKVIREEEDTWETNIKGKVHLLCLKCVELQFDPELVKVVLEVKA